MFLCWNNVLVVEQKGRYRFPSIPCSKENNEQDLYCVPKMKSDQMNILQSCDNVFRIFYNSISSYFIKLYITQNQFILPPCQNSCNKILCRRVIPRSPVHCFKIIAIRLTVKRKKIQKTYYVN